MPEELKIEKEPLRKLMKEALDDVGASKGVDVGIEDDDAETALAEQRKEMAARGQADGVRVRQHTGATAQHRSTQQHNNCHRKQRQQPRKKEEEEKGQEGRKREEEREAEEGGGEQVKKDATGWKVVTRSKKQKQRRVQIFVKVNGSKATPMEVNLMDDKVEDVMRQIQNDEDVYVTMNGKVLRSDEKLKNCGVSDGCAIQVTSRMRGGGKHKDKKSKVEKKQVTRQEPVRNEGPAVLESEKEADGLCAMVCEQMRWAMETVNTLQSTDEDKRRIAEEVEKVKKAMAGMEKQATGGDLQRVAEMEEGLKKLEKEVQAKDVDDQKMTMNFAETGEKEDTREGGGCAGHVQGRDETHRRNETSGKGKGKGNGGKGKHGGKGEDGDKGVQQSAKMMKDEEEQEADKEDERGRVAPNMGAGGSHPQATSDLQEEENEKKEARVLRWADCNDEDGKEEEEEWKRKVMGLCGSDEEQDGKEEATEEGEERRKREESEERVRRERKESEEKKVARSRRIWKAR